jgi:hypothetical protein
MVRRGFHLYSIKVDRTGILYMARAVGCTGRDSRLNEASLVFIQLKYSTHVVGLACSTRP